MQRLLQVLFWSVIAAAFVGPGTVTTCARAGASHGTSLLWAVAFSTIACLVLQEASARITAISGKNLGQSLRETYRGGGGTLVLSLVVGGVVGGCIAYQAGNLAGAASGTSLAIPGAGPATIAISSALAGILLWTARAATVSKLLGAVVAVMGACFFATAILVKPDLGSLARGLLIPSFPAGSNLLIVAVIGTTVVPYNLFLGSGIARAQRLGEIRFGLSIAVILGGLISMAILIVGSSLSGEFSFAALGTRLAAELGPWARWLFAVGLFCAGFTSAITAPLAAALTARSLFERPGEELWHERGVRYRTTWLIVMLVGAGFGLAAARPVQLIVLAQALNGVLLPFVAIFLLLSVNDRRRMGDRVNSLAVNLLTAGVVLVSMVLGLSNVLAATLGRGAFSDQTLGLGAGLLSLVLAVPVALALRRRRLAT